MIIPTDYRLERRHAPMLLWLGMTYLEVMQGLGVDLHELERICHRSCGASPQDVRLRGVRAEIRHLLARGVDDETTARTVGVSVTTLRALANA